MGASRWLNWTPERAEILEAGPGANRQNRQNPPEATFDSFVSAEGGSSPIFSASADPSETCNAAGVRILRTPAGGYIIALPAASDGPEVRRALEVLGMGGLPVWVVVS